MLAVELERGQVADGGAVNANHWESVVWTFLLEGRLVFVLFTRFTREEKR